MADVEKFMSVEAGDIEKIMGVETGDIEAVMGVEYPASGLAWAGTTALIMGGNHFLVDTGASRSINDIQYKTLTTDGNTADWGDLSSAKQESPGSGSNKSRIVYGGGRRYAASNTFSLTEIDYMTVASAGTVGDAGDMEEGAHEGGNGGASNGTLCFFVGGGGLDENMEQMTISSTSGSADAGDLSEDSVGTVTTNGDSKFLVIGMGKDVPAGGKEDIDQHNFNTSANTTDYGNVATVGVGSSAGVSAVNKIVVAGGYIGTPTAYTAGTRMQFFPVASSADGDSSDSADLVVAATHHAATSDGTRGEWYGGGASADDGFQQNDIQKVTIASLANASDIGDLTTVSTLDPNTWDDADSGGIKAAQAQTGT
tara:strand:- start:1678 stop:2784 length:1107 start_codon:yes stop_codon:yes gene_type:complete